MKLSVTGSYILMLQDSSLVENAPVPYPIEFVFDKSWDGFAKTVQFKAGANNASIALTEDRCEIPAECLKTAGVWLQICIVGVKGEEVISTGWRLTSLIMHQMNLETGTGGGNGGGSGNGDGCSCIPNETYEELKKVIGDLTAAGFEGKSLVDVILELQNSISTTATDDEVGGMIEDVFGAPPSSPGLPGEESSSNTATDQEVDDVLNAVFGEQP